MLTPASIETTSFYVSNAEPDSEIMSAAEFDGIPTTILTIALGISLAINIYLYFALRTLLQSQKSKDETQVDVSGLTSSLINPAEIPASLPPSPKQKIEEVLQPLSRDQILDLLYFLIEKHEALQTLESSKMLNLVQDLLTGLQSVHNGYEKLSKKSKSDVNDDEYLSMQSDYADLAKKYMEFLIRYTHLDLYMVNTDEHPLLISLCNEVSSYYPVAVGRYLLHLFHSSK